MLNIIYKSPFKDHIQNCVELKQAIGYKYNSEAHHLRRFDQFILEKYSEATVLTKEIVLDWCRKKTYETQTNQCFRASIIRQFGKYLESIGIKAYIIPKGYYPSAKQYTPYIYTTEELAKFFAETDKCQYCCECPYRHQIMPVIFRMIYLCGLRASEARLLKVVDVDLENGILSINHSKKDNSRLVSMSDSLTERCRDFSKKVHTDSMAENYYFPALGGKPMTLVNLYHNFRRFLWRAKISHGGKGCGPRIHDFRHTYAVHCLKKWVSQEKDLTVYLPVLKTYMGHDSFKDTAYYLRMTADVFPDITLKMETHYLDIVPTLEGGSNETY
ncbi:MAG TPA: tyrosine-type recombinase/integrase [Alphaproteobacteria bacterium]|nr:tyrosine-type recombinase/integrase [Alphaproteobacteria bacterium]HQS84953.1 tyrosine-type recombinase/integrase [Alphaproteobacteria bacterium]